MEAETTLGILNPCGGGDPIPLRRPKLLVGRRSSCDITLRFSNVSSHHCQLELKAGYWVVRDLGSRNGVKVNGESVESKFLMPGDILRVAKHEFEIDYTPTSDGPAPEEENPFSRSLMEKAGLAKPERDPLAETDAEPEPLPKVRTRSEDDFYLEWMED
jgi:adenylate cyclase